MNMVFKPWALDAPVGAVGVLLLAFRAGRIAGVLMVSFLLMREY
jgi:hypothetical protein